MIPTARIDQAPFYDAPPSLLVSLPWNGTCANPIAAVERGPFDSSPSPEGTGKLSFSARLLPVSTSFLRVAWLILACAR